MDESNLVKGLYSWSQLFIVEWFVILRRQCSITLHLLLLALTFFLSSMTFTEAYGDDRSLTYGWASNDHFSWLWPAMSLLCYLFLFKKQLLWPSLALELICRKKRSHLVGSLTGISSLFSKTTASSSSSLLKSMTSLPTGFYRVYFLIGADINSFLRIGI